MKKISSKIYAQALYQISQKTDDLDGALRNFAKVLYQKNQLSMINGILTQFTKIYNREQKSADAIIETSHKLSGDNLKKINDWLAEITQAKKLNSIEKVNPQLIGGLKISLDGVEIDASVRSRLESLKILD